MYPLTPARALSKAILRVLFATIALLLTLRATPATAHPMSVSPMEVRLAAQGLEVDLTVDAPLELRGRDERQRQQLLERELRTGLFIKADGVPLHYTIDIQSLGDPAQDSAAVHRVTLRSPVPDEAQALTVKASRSFGGLRLRVIDPARTLTAEFLVPGGYETPAFQLRGDHAVHGHASGKPIVVGPLPLSFDDPGVAEPVDAGSAPLSHQASLQTAPSASATAWSYLFLGFEHILPLGLDHILFVLALFFLSPRLKPLLLQLTAFTFAHSLTLGLVSFGVMSPPAAIVEPLIAASIVFVGVENLRKQRLGAVRLAVVVLFGLLHGMGFADALGELGLPAGQEWIALAAFNIGVEFGQIAVVAMAALLTWKARVSGEHPHWVRVPASGAIALMGLFWVVERVFL